MVLKYAGNMLVCGALNGGVEGYAVVVTRWMQTRGGGRKKRFWRTSFVSFEIPQAIRKTVLL